MKRLLVQTSDQIEAALPAILAHLAEDGLIGYPTETVYGFGGGTSHAAAAALRALKSREQLKPFLLLVTSPDQAPGVQWSESARAIAALYWPGPLTIALPARSGAFPEGIIGIDGTVALRASPHPFVRRLLEARRAPITSTSANAPGTRPARSAEEVIAALDALDARHVLVLDGGTLPESASSTIVAVEDRTARILREGAIPTEQLRHQLSGIGIDVR